MTPNSDIDCLRSILHEHLRQRITGDHVVLLDFPRHDNVGDSAIWCGEVAALSNLGIGIRYAADQQSFRHRTMQRYLSNDTTILVHGGGNFGDLWPERQQFRLEIAQAYPAHRIVQLPQSINFGSDASLGRTRSVLNRHPDFHVLARDDRSLEVAERLLGTDRAALTPDAAFGLTLDARQPAVAVRDLLVLARQDHEAGDRGLGPFLERQSIDWSAIEFRGRRRLQRAAAFRCERRLRGRPLFGTTHPSTRLLTSIASGLLRSGVELLESSSVVIADRLHVHVLCLLLGKKHVVVPDRFGKITDFMDTWGYGGDFQLADTFDEALDLAR